MRVSSLSLTLLLNLVVPLALAAGGEKAQYVKYEYTPPAPAQQTR